MKRAILFFLTGILLCLFSCNKENDNYPVPPENSGSDSFVVNTIPFKTGSQEYLADYGNITVLENRNNPESRLISLPFLRIHSNSENPSEPVFGLSGGPGQSNLKWDWGFTGNFLSDHDFVFVGYRGIDGTTVLDCPEVAKAFKKNNDLLSNESLRVIGQAWYTAGKRLKEEGVDIDGYTMTECIEDNESVRMALDYDRINLLSTSYGTRVAYLYGLKHPEHIFRSAMICVNPPGRFVWESKQIDIQLRYYSSLWSKDPVMSGKTQNLYLTIQNVLKDMPDRWLFVPINTGKVKVVTFSLLFHRKTAAMVFDAYVAAEKGDASGLAIMSIAYDFVVPSLMVWGDLASKAVSADFDSTRNYSADMEPVSGMPLGSPMSMLLWSPLSNGGWPVNLIPEEFRTLGISDVETLLLSGNIDFSTPAEYATNELLPYLTKGKQIILSEYGHVGDVIYGNTESTRLILKSFFSTGVADTSLNAYLPMDFTVKLGFPAIAKIGAGVFALVIIMFGAVIFWFIRLLRKRCANNEAGRLKV